MKITKLEAFPISIRYTRTEISALDRARGRHRCHRQAHGRQRAGWLGRSLHEQRDRRHPEGGRGGSTFCGWPQSLGHGAYRAGLFYRRRMAVPADDREASLSPASTWRCGTSWARKRASPSTACSAGRSGKRCAISAICIGARREDVAAQCDDGIRRGYDTYYFKVGVMTPRKEEQLLEVIREHIGPGRQAAHRCQPGLDRSAGRSRRSSAGTACSTSILSRVRCRSNPSTSRRK